MQLLDSNEHWSTQQPELAESRQRASFSGARRGTGCGVKLSSRFSHKESRLWAATTIATLSSLRPTNTVACEVRLLCKSACHPASAAAIPCRSTPSSSMKSSRNTRPESQPQRSGYVACPSLVLSDIFGVCQRLHAAQHPPPGITASSW